jgi:DNA-directed RNA polymerase subunit RPC12/RpoP
MSTPVCTLCGEPLTAREAERSVCLLCRHRTLPHERAAADRRLLGLIDSA